MNLNEFLELLKTGVVTIGPENGAAVPDSTSLPAPSSPDPRDLTPRELTAREMREFATRILVAFLGKNEIAQDNVGAVVADVLQALSSPEAYARFSESPTPAGRGAAQPEPVPAAQPSDDPRFVTCMDCGRKMRSLKRHLWDAHKLSPADYRERWKLAADYPLVAQELSERRSSAALESGFGQVRSTAKRSRKG